MSEHLQPPTGLEQLALPPEYEYTISPEQSEQVTNAIATIGGVGAVAVSHELPVPVELALEREGFISKRWQSMKNSLQGFDLRNSRAGQAITEAGVEFSKWDAAKAALYEAGGTVTQLARVITAGVVTPFTRTTNEKRTYKISRANAGVANPVLRKKLAEGLLAPTDSSNPVYAHLRQTSIHAGDRQTRREIRADLYHEVATRADRIQEKRFRKQQRNTR